MAVFPTSTTVLDSLLFRDAFGTPRMREVFSDLSSIARYAEVEIALARAQARCGVIPADAADEIAKRTNVSALDFDLLRQETEIVGYPILPLVQQMVKQCGEAGRYVHWGATTQDIMDTALVLQLRDGLAIIEQDIATLRGILANLSRRYRDALAEVVNFLGLVTGSLGKIALDIMIMASTEFAELYEPFVKGRGASSTMPQKRNPISSELMLAASKAVRQHAGLMLDAMVQDLERATGPWHAEWMAIPESFVLSAGALHQAKFALQGLVVDEQQMTKHLGISRGLIVAEAVMMGLAPQIGRQEAHDVVYDACRLANEKGLTLADALSSDSRVSSRIDGATI